VAADAGNGAFAFPPMNWPEFQHEAMATAFAIVIADHPADYAAQAAAAAFRELDRLERELSRFVESSDVARANRLGYGQAITIGDDTLQCLLLACEVTAATDRAFDVAYASERAPEQPNDAPVFTIDPESHRLVSRAVRLQLDLGAIGKGYALDCLATVLQDWGITTACLHGGGSTVLALAAPSGWAGWPVGVGQGTNRRTFTLTHCALSGSGTAVKGNHLFDPRSEAIAARTDRVWAFASGAGLSDALSTAFFVMSDAQIALFCAAHSEVGAISAIANGGIVFHGAARNLAETGRLEESEVKGVRS
jgi:thiamine biosynthesis lipoprotein